MVKSNNIQGLTTRTGIIASIRDEFVARDLVKKSEKKMEK